MRKSGKIRVSLNEGQPMKCPIIFLDFDGVLHDIEEGEKALFSETAREPRLFIWAETLSSLLAPFPRVAVVIHSAWRNVFSLSDLTSRLPLELSKRVIGMTEPGLPRWDSIQLYLNDRDTSCACVILDDSPDEFPSNHPMLIACHPSRGLSDESTQTLLASWLSRHG